MVKLQLTNSFVGLYLSSIRCLVSSQHATHASMLMREILALLHGSASACSRICSLAVDVVVEATLEAVDEDHLHECAVLAVPRHEVADELVVRHVLNVVHVKSNCVFLGRPLRGGPCCPVSALNHAVMSASSKLPQWVCRRESFSFVLCHGLSFCRYSISSSWIRNSNAASRSCVPYALQPHSVVVRCALYMGGRDALGLQYFDCVFALFLCH